MADESEAGEGDEARVLEWEIGLPTADDLTPLSQALIPPDLAAAFSIAPEPTRTMLQVHRASHVTVSALRRLSSPSSAAALGSFSPFSSPPLPADDDRPDAPTAAAAAAEAEAEEEEADSARTIKRPRLVWTPPLHKRFVDVVGHLGIKNAVPKTIMLLMNVEGLTRENVASHLQKYRIYLKKLQGVPTECPPSSSSSSDHLFASTPLPQGLHDPALALMPMPAMIPVTISSHSYGACAEMQKDWPATRNFASMASYSSVTPSDK